MKKRILCAVLAAAMAASVLAGCGGDTKPSSSAPKEDKPASSPASQSTPESTPASTGEAVEIEFVQQKRESVDSFQAVIDLFQEKNPNITVKQSVMPDAATVLMTRASTNEMPDVLMHWPTDSQYIQFAQQGRLRPLDDVCMDNVLEQYIDVLKSADGHNYCLPFSCNFMGVFYDTEKFAAAKYEVPKTWDELITIAKDIKSKGEVAFMFPDKDAWTISQLWSNIEGKNRPDNAQYYADLRSGATTFQDDELANDAWKKILELHEYSQGDTLSLGYDQCISDFATGTGYMFIQGIWASASIEAANPDKKFNMFPMPNDSGDIKQPIGLDTGICAGADSSPEKAAAADLFLKFMSTTEAAQLYSDLDHSPSCIKGVNAVIPQGQGIVDILAEKGVLSVASLPAGFEETKRSKIQNVILNGDITGYLTEMTSDYLAACQAEDEQTS